ncbi:RNI-like protein [Pseudovirgaria hyperparasitica]|uniref:RNI-like protein n=1 Tax=Pseudovirgaria hyperparasitica TaxID=470096 RepID=A0A6A6VYC7_9PEZI|nr:RNI-like protein [Pseudovirgaria hyperparasitica]KAF2755205.1 RNI-like protein [Pseudovirgaria hyperparasitica]
MRRYNRPGGGPTIHASRVNGASFPDPLTLIRAYDSETNPSRPIRPSPLTASTIQGLPLDLLDRLRSFPLFQQAPDSFLQAIGTHLRPQVYSPHDYILTEGDDAKAMYWLVRGSVRVTSRDGESTYAELKPGSFFGEIGILMDIPRTATIIANMRCLVVRLNKEDLKKELPVYPEVERAIRDEANERLAYLEKKKKENKLRAPPPVPAQGLIRSTKRPRDRVDGDVEMGEAGMLFEGEVVNMYKKRKSPSPSLVETSSSSALATGTVSIRPLLKELPLFSRLPPEILHFLGIRAQPRSFPPFHEIVKQGSTDRDVYFIVKGEVEVVAERTPIASESVQLDPDQQLPITRHVKARLRAGQYFGEVTSLSLSPSRTATVRSVTSVECLMISDNVLNDLWRQCSPDIRQQVESVAKQRLQTASEPDVTMSDVVENTIAIDELEIGDQGPRTPRKNSVPFVTFSDAAMEAPVTPSKSRDMMEPFDPDPFLNPDLDNMRSRSRRNSLAPPTPASPVASQSALAETPASPSPKEGRRAQQPETGVRLHPPRPRSRLKRRSSRFGKGILPDSILTSIFQYLELHELMRLRLVSLHWLRILSSSDVLHYLDLAKYNRRITDSVLTTSICPFVGNRPRVVDLSNCFHISDEGFATLAASCGENVKVWKMKSVWDITGQAVLDMVSKAKGLEEIDLSNCRKVGDNLLARVVGWVVPNIPPAVFQQQQQQEQAQAQAHANQRRGKHHPQQQQQPVQQLPPGTVIGCPKLKRLTLSYCKHITDRSMAHIAIHASKRIESMDLTRCTTITDNGFHQWSGHAFPKLSRLCLADCTYLTDNAIVYLTNAAKQLRELDLSFCCALSDTATEVLALGCQNLTHLNMAFCGSAVSDHSLATVALHLTQLRHLSVRGCVRVTGMGVEHVLDGCMELEFFDVSQCKNLARWLESGGVERRGRGVRFETVTEGRWRGGGR